MDVTLDNCLGSQSLVIIARVSNHFLKGSISENVDGSGLMLLSGLYYSITLEVLPATLLYFLARARPGKPCNSLTVKYLRARLDAGELSDLIAKSYLSLLSRVESLAASALIKLDQGSPKETSWHALQSARET